MNRPTAIKTLRAIARTTFESLPLAARKTLNGVQVYRANLGYTTKGRKILGTARSDGRVVLLDTDTLERYADRPGRLETLLAHELAHCYRTLTGVADTDERREERATNRLLKSWGFRPADLNKFEEMPCKP